MPAGKSLGGALVGLLLALPPAAAEYATPIGEVSTHGFWSVVAREGNGPGFGFCSADITFQDDLYFAVLLLRDATIQLFIDSPAFALPTGQLFETSVRIDDRVKRAIQAELQTTSLYATLGVDQRFLEALTTARVIAFATPGDDLELPVADTGLADAVPALVDCLARHAGMGPDGKPRTQ